MKNIEWTNPDVGRIAQTIVTQDGVAELHTNQHWHGTFAEDGTWPTIWKSDFVIDILPTEDDGFFAAELTTLSGETKTLVRSIDALGPCLETLFDIVEAS